MARAASVLAIASSVCPVVARATPRARRVAAASGERRELIEQGLAFVAGEHGIEEQRQHARVGRTGLPRSPKFAHGRGGVTGSQIGVSEFDLDVGVLRRQRFRILQVDDGDVRVALIHGLTRLPQQVCQSGGIFGIARRAARDGGGSGSCEGADGDGNHQGLTDGHGWISGIRRAACGRS
jgi:hypothetical protein